MAAQKDNKEKTLNQKIREQIVRHMKAVEENSDQLYGRWAARKNKLERVKKRYS